MNTKEHQLLAKEVAEEAITLLKNDGDILPLDRSKVKTIAVLGPNAADFPVSGGGSSSLEPPYRVSPLQGLLNKVNGEVTIFYEPGCDNFVDLPILKGEKIQPAQGQGFGLNGKYYNNLNFTGNPVLERIDDRFNFWWFEQGPSKELGNQFSACWTGKIVVQQSGLHTLGLANTGIGRIYIDGNLLFENHPDNMAKETTIKSEQQTIELDSKRKYDIRIEYIRSHELSFANLKVTLAYTPLPENDDRFTRAVDAARNADLAIIFAGMPENFETEGVDRPHMRLPGRQDEFISSVSKVNPRTIVVLNCGSPVELPWIDEVSAVLEAFYPGLEGGNAIANILVGEANPSGKLPVTFPIRYEDNPTFGNYPGTRQVFYGEGIFVGYRYYDFKIADVLFPFGHGLSYTQYEYSDLQAPEIVKNGDNVKLSIKVRNIGKRAGKEIIQLYIQDEVSSLIRPIKELKGFAKVSLDPGEEKTIDFEITHRDLSFYQPFVGEWISEPGVFRIMVGSSSRDIRLQKTFVLI